jgi:hypothetical protein
VLLSKGGRAGLRIGPLKPQNRGLQGCRNPSPNTPETPPQTPDPSPRKTPNRSKINASSPNPFHSTPPSNLGRIEPEKLLAPRDESLNRVRNILQAAAAAGLGALAVASGFDLSRVLGALVPATFLLVADQVGRRARRSKLRASVKQWSNEREEVLVNINWLTR